MRAEFPNPEHALLPGMYVRARFEQAVDELRAGGAAASGGSQRGRRRRGLAGRGRRQRGQPATRNQTGAASKTGRSGSNARLEIRGQRDCRRITKGQAGCGWSSRCRGKKKKKKWRQRQDRKVEDLPLIEHMWFEILHRPADVRLGDRVVHRWSARSRSPGCRSRNTHHRATGDHRDIDLPGASAETLDKSVTRVIEQQMNGAAASANRVEERIDRQVEITHSSRAPIRTSRWSRIRTD